MLTGTVHGYDYNHLVNTNYTGSCIQVAKGAASAKDVVQDIGFVDGKVDRSAIISFYQSSGAGHNANGSVYLYKIYDQFGVRDITYSSIYNLPLIYDGAFAEDSFGRIIAKSTGGGGQNFEVQALDVTSTFSLYMRIGAMTNTIGAGFGFGNNTSFYSHFGESASTSTSTVAGFGTPKLWVDGVNTTANNRGENYTAYSASGYKTLATTGATYPTGRTENFEFFRGGFDLMDAPMGTILVYDRDTEVDHTTINTFIENLYLDPPVFNPITQNGVIQQGVIVDIEAYDDYTKTTGYEFVETVTTDIDGIAQMTVLPPAGKKLFVTPHLNDGGTLSSDQGKFVSDNF